MNLLAIFTLAAALLSATPSLASGIVIDFSTPITDAAGKPVQDCDHVDFTDPKNPTCDKYVALTLGRLAAGAVDQPEQGLKAGDLVIRGQLATRIRKALLDFHSTQGKVELDQRDVDLIKDQIAKMRLSPSVVAQAFELLAPAPEAAPAKK